MGKPQLKGGELLCKEGGRQELRVGLPAQKSWQLQQAHLGRHVPCLRGCRAFVGSVLLHASDIAPSVTSIDSFRLALNDCFRTAHRAL